jgi:hypothetical protein
MLGTELDRDGLEEEARDVDVWNVESIGIRITHVGLVHTKNMFYSPENAPPREIIHSHIYSRSSVELQSKPCWGSLIRISVQQKSGRERETDRAS